MKRYILTILAVWCCVGLNVPAQNDDFQEFRNRVLDDYQKFRKKILTDYDKYLQGVWERFQGQPGEKPKDLPGPKTPPIYDNTPIEEPVVTKPVVPIDMPVPSLEPITAPKPVAPTIRPVTPIAPPLAGNVEISFYGMKMKLPKIEIAKLSGTEPDELASYWRTMNGSVSKYSVPILKNVVDYMNLNGWLAFDFVRTYVLGMAKGYRSDERVMIIQCILTNLGYDVRIGKTSDGKLVMLAPFNEKMYSTVFLNIDQQRYYVLTDGTFRIDTHDPPAIYTCTLPKDSALGGNLSLLLNGINVESDEFHEYNITDGRITITGKVDSCLMEMLRHYPQMDISSYAASSILPDIRIQIVDQIRTRIEGMSQQQAVNALLHFVQNGFSYATDEKQHGYEKYYFLEENLFYPKNDCEDRAILFGYLVKELLGLHVQLISYPGHESCAVNFKPENVIGDGYICNERKWIISDPTYINANAGMCMSTYKNATPDIDYEY